MLWDGLAAAVTGRRSWLLGLGVVLPGIGLMVLIGGNGAAGQAPLSVPPGSDSARVDALARRFPGGDRAPLIVVVNRADGAVLDPADATAARSARDRMQRSTGQGVVGVPPTVVSADGKAAIGVVPVSAELSGLALGVVAPPRSPPSPAPGGAHGGARHRRQQRHRGAGVAHPAVRLHPQHPQPGRVGRVRTGRRRGLRADGAAAAAGGVRPPVVLAVRPAPRGRCADRCRAVAPGRRPGGQASGPRRGGRHRGPGRPGHRPAGNAHRLVADRTVPATRRFGDRV